MVALGCTIHQMTTKITKSTTSLSSPFFFFELQQQQISNLTNLVFRNWFLVNTLMQRNKHRFVLCVPGIVVTLILSTAKPALTSEDVEKPSNHSGSYF